MFALDADLQNPPEEIPRLVAKIEEGFDTVGGWRENRRDSFFRRLPSLMVNRLMSYVTGVALKDYGCMLRAYRREVVDSINQCQESSSFIPALANIFSHRVTEIPVGHAERERGESKYNLIKLIHLNFDVDHPAAIGIRPHQVVEVHGGLAEEFIAALLLQGQQAALYCTDAGGGYVAVLGLEL